jgi:hypothetical protein
LRDEDRGAPAAELRGDVVAVQVRSTRGGARQRVTLDRADAETAMRMECPYMLAAVETSSKRVMYRFLDTQFAEELVKFLRTDHETLTLRLDSGFRAKDFREALDRNSRPGVQNRLRIRSAELSVEAEIKGARLQVVHDADEGFAIVEVPWISSIFSVVPEHGDALARMVFQEGKLPKGGTPGFALHPSLIALADVAAADHLVVRGGFEIRARGFVELGDKREPMDFRIRRVGAETAMISDCGIVLTLSECLEEEGSHFHQVRCMLSSEFDRRLDNFADFDSALKLLRKGAKVILPESGVTMTAALWGPGFESLGEAYEDVLVAAKVAGLPLGTFRLASGVGFAASAARHRRLRSCAWSRSPGE